MDFISETKFNAPIKGGMPSILDNGKDDLNIKGNLILSGNICETGSLSVTEDIEACGKISARNIEAWEDVSARNIEACGNITASGCGHVEGHVVEGDIGNFTDFKVGKGGGVCSSDLTFSVNSLPAEICVFSRLTVYDDIRFVMGADCGNYDTCFWTLKNNAGRLEFTGSGYDNGMYIDNATLEVNSLKILSSDIPDGCEGVEVGLELNGEKITSWSDLTKYVGGGTEANNKIQRFTSPALPANCSKFYFEGDETVTGTELPFIQVRETATGKLFQMDVWVNLDEACTGVTLGKPVAEVEPCTSAIEAGKWTAIVMN